MLSPNQKKQIAEECYKAEENLPGSKRGHERKEFVIQTILELLRPSLYGWKISSWMWRPMSLMLAHEIAKTIDWIISVWRRNHGCGWINIRKSRLIKEIENTALI